MTDFSHLGITMVHNMRERHGYTEDWEVNLAIDADIKRTLLRTKSALNLTMHGTAEKDARRLDDADIQRLRNYEVALVYADMHTPYSNVDRDRLSRAINGENLMGQLNDSSRYAARKEYALQQKPEPQQHGAITFKLS